MTLWNIVVYVALTGEGNSDFSDAGLSTSRTTAGKAKSSQINAAGQQKSQPNTQRANLEPRRFQTFPCPI